MTTPGTGAPTPNEQVILTGNGGPIEEGSGWTGWTDLDNGNALSSEGMAIAPCFQVGVISDAVDGTPDSVLAERILQWLQHLGSGVHQRSGYG